MLIEAVLAATGCVVFPGLAAAFLCCREEFRRDRVPALVYHRFLSKGDIKGGAPDNERINVTYDFRFKEQMDYLAQEGFQPISAEDLLGYVKEEQRLPERPVLITFDDGFRSVYRHAFPVLRAHGFRATIFVTPDAESENFRNFRGFDSAMTTDEMREMVEAGISVQSHGMTHRILTELPPEELRWELVESKSVLESVAGKPVQCLSIPWGPFNRAVKGASKEAGYEAVFGNKKGSNHRGSDLYDLRRVVVERDFSLADFAKSLSPLGTCQLRIQGWVKRLAFLLLGNRRLIRFRGSPFFRAFIAPWFAFGRLKGVLLAGYTLSVLLFGAALYMWFIAQRG